MGLTYHDTVLKDGDGNAHFPRTDMASVHNADGTKSLEMVSSDHSNNFAGTFSETLTYAKGVYVVYNDKLYRCITAIAVAGVWDDSKWVLVSVGSELASINAILNVLVANIELDYANAVSMAPYTSSGNAFTVPKFGVLIGESGYAAAGSYKIYDLKATTITMFGQPKCIYAATVPMGVGSPINITIGKGSQIYVAMPSVDLYYVPFK